MKQNEPATGIPVAQVPYANAPHQGGVGQFSTGLCDCFSDCSLSCGSCGALYALLMIPGMIVGGFTGCQWIYSCTYRSKLKAQYGIPEDCCGDCCVHFCCETCALCQEYRELEHRGYNLALGWHGNMERQNPGMAAPAMPGGMTR